MPAHASSTERVEPDLVEIDNVRVDILHQIWLTGSFLLTRNNETGPWSSQNLYIFTFKLVLKLSKTNMYEIARDTQLKSTNHDAA